MSSPRVLLAGRPNVGKSSLFNCISDSYAIVSNYPGTTVGVSKGKIKGKDESIEVLDLPGFYQVASITDEERVAVKALLSESNDLIIHVVDAKSLPIHIPVTLCLMEFGKPIILAINMSDEMNKYKIKIDLKALEERLGIQAVLVSSQTKSGMADLDKLIKSDWSKLFPKKNILKEAVGICLSKLKDFGFTQSVENTLASPTVLNFLLLQKDQEALEIARDKNYYQKVVELESENKKPFNLELHHLLKDKTGEILKGVFEKKSAGHVFQTKLSSLMINPFYGFIFLAIFLYFGFFVFVGQFAAGTVVGWLENDLFGDIVIPAIKTFFNNYMPWAWVTDLMVGEYGVISLGITYALALVLPIVFFFFLVFSILEDSGYFPRLAMLIDRLFKLAGMNGRAVIPIVLGFGCDTMATITTRTLETKKEKIISTFLLAFAIPCSAQLGLITGLLGEAGFVYWVSYVVFLIVTFFITGFALSKILKGENSYFFMEMPPLRMPRISSVLIKSFSRMKWYFIEVIPLFLWTSVILFILDKLSILVYMLKGIRPIMGLLGLPADAAESFLIGFFRRDFGAAGFFELIKNQIDNHEVAKITGHQIFVASVTLTLFVPCVAQFMVMWKERGPVKAISIFIAISVLAISFGSLLHHTMTLIGV